VGHSFKARSFREPYGFAGNFCPAFRKSADYSSWVFGINDLNVKRLKPAFPLGQLNINYPMI
jgi:hypothetical protein